MSILNEKIYIYDLKAKQVYTYDKNEHSHKHHAPFIQIIENENLLVMNTSDYVYTVHAKNLVGHYNDKICNNWRGNRFFKIY